MNGSGDGIETRSKTESRTARREGNHTLDIDKDFKLLLLLFVPGHGRRVVQRTEQRRKRNHAQDTGTCKACTDPANQRPRSTAFSITSSQERGLHSAQETRQRLYTCTVKSALSRAGFAVELFTAWRSASAASHLQAGTPPKSMASADSCGQKKGNCTRVQILKSLLSKQSCR